MENDIRKEDLTESSEESTFKVGGTIAINVFERDIIYLINTKDISRILRGLDKSHLPAQPPNPEDDSPGPAD